MKALAGYIAICCKCAALCFSALRAMAVDNVLYLARYFEMNSAAEAASLINVFIHNIQLC